MTPCRITGAADVAAITAKPYDDFIAAHSVIDVAEVNAKPGMLQLTLQATQGEAHEFTLKLPREALGQRAIAVGDVVHARNRPYGLEFARTNAARAREAFFLVLADDWHKELDSRPVAL